MDQIDEVVMVGGSTRIPLVRSAVENLFRSKPHTELNPDEVVALGRRGAGRRFFLEPSTINCCWT